MPKTIRRRKELMNSGESDDKRLNIIATQMLSSVISRASLASQLGKMTYGGNRDLYAALGYPITLDYRSYATMFERSEIADAVIRIPPNYSWRTWPIINDKAKGDEDTTTQFEKEFVKIQKQLKLFSVMKQADIISGIGQYGVILLGLSDNQPLINPVQANKLKLLYVQCFSEGNATIASWEENQQNERYGLPLTYQLGVSFGQSMKTVTAHHSRIIHITEDNLGNNVYGTPRLRNVFNRLLDIEKLAGGSGEMFWRGAFPGYNFKLDPDIQVDQKEIDTLKTDISDLVNSLKRYIRTRGLTVEALETQVVDPSNHINIMVDLVALGRGIPKRILLGSERGQLSSDQDERNWSSKIDERRINHVIPNIVNPFVDRGILYGFLPPTEEYNVDWPSLFSVSEKDKATTAKDMTTAIRDYITSEASNLIPIELYLKKVVGFTQDEVTLCVEYYNQMMEEENDQIEEDERILGEMEKKIKQEDRKNKVK